MGEREKEGGIDLVGEERKRKKGVIGLGRERKRKKGGEAKVEECPLPQFSWGSPPALSTIQTGCQIFFFLKCGGSFWF